MTSKEHYIIIGNGPAGNIAADTLRAHDKAARVTIISSERFPFYYRHKLPAFAAGALDEEALTVRPFTIYKDNNVSLRLGQRVDRIDPAEKILFLSHNETVRYTRLILALGGKPHVPPYLRNSVEHLWFLNNYEDAVRIRPALQKAKTVLLLGGDLVSLSVKNQLAAMKKKIIFLLNPDGFWPLQLTGEMAGAISAGMKRQGIEVVANDDLRTVARRKSGLLAVTDSGREFAVDLVGCFAGLRPNVGFLAGSGIDTERGILVDDHLRANRKNIYACGDCAQIYNPGIRNYWVSIGWHNAELQGRAAALNLLGDNKVIKPPTKKILDVDGVHVNTSWWKDF